MSAFLWTASRWGGILTIIVLVITLLRQLIKLVGVLLFAIKAGLIIAFVAVMLLIVLAMLRTRQQRRREESVDL